MRAATASHANVPVTEYDPLVTGQVFEAHRTTSVELLRAYGYLSAQPELSTVVKPRTGIHQDGGRIDLLDKAVRTRPIICKDTVCVLCAMPLDVVNGFIQTVDDPQAQDQGEPFSVKIVWPGQRSLPVIPTGL